MSKRNTSQKYSISSSGRGGTFTQSGTNKIVGDLATYQQQESVAGAAQAGIITTTTTTNNNNNNGNGKRRGTAGSRLSVHSLFFPSSYSTPVSGGGPATNPAVTNTVQTAGSTTKWMKACQRPSKMSRSANDLQNPTAMENVKSKQRSVLAANESNHNGSTERLLANSGENRKGATSATASDRIAVDVKGTALVPSGESPASRSGSASDQDRDSLANISTVTAASVSGASGTGATKTKMRECPLCLARQPSVNFPLLSYCHHRSCQNCLVQYLHMEILESRVNVTCPECNEPMHPNDIYKILSDHEPNLIVAIQRNHLIGKYEEFSVRRVLMSDPDTRWCPAPDCSYAVIATGCAACPELRCQRPGCGALFCYHCKMTWHPNQTCDEARFQRGSFAASPIPIDSTIRHGFLAGDIKACPRCRTYIVKMNDGSCNHMICALCGAEFCWLCLREISDLHYLSPSGCTFWGKKPWSRKKKLLWQLGMLVGAPVGIALVAGLAVPAIIFGVPVWVGRKVHQKLKDSSKAKRRVAIAGSVFGSVLMSPVLASMAVGVGVPILLAYVYGVVPLSLCRNGSCGVTASSSGVRLVDEDILAMTGFGGSESTGNHEKAQLLKDVDKQDASTVAGFSMQSGSTQHKLQIQADVCSTGTGGMLVGGLTSNTKHRRSSMESGATTSLCGDRCFNYEEASTKALAGSTYYDDKSVHTMESGGGGSYFVEPDQASNKGLCGSAGGAAGAETKSSKSVSSGAALGHSSSTAANADNASTVGMAGSICGVTVDASNALEPSQCSRCGGRRFSLSVLRNPSQHGHSSHQHHHHVHIDEQFVVDEREETSCARQHSVEPRITRFADDPYLAESAEVSLLDRHYGILPIDEESNTASIPMDDQVTSSLKCTSSSSQRGPAEKLAPLRRLPLRSGASTVPDDTTKHKRSLLSIENDPAGPGGQVDLKSMSASIGGTISLESSSSVAGGSGTGGVPEERRCRLHREECHCDDAEFLLLPPDAYIVQNQRYLNPALSGSRRFSTSSGNSHMKKSRSWSALLLEGGGSGHAMTSSIAAELWSTVRGAFMGGPNDPDPDTGYHHQGKYAARNQKRTNIGLVQRLRCGRRATFSTSVANMASTSKRTPVDKKSSKLDVASSCTSLPDTYPGPISTSVLYSLDSGVRPLRQRVPSGPSPSKSGGGKRLPSAVVSFFTPSNDAVETMSVTQELKLSNFTPLDDVKERVQCSKCGVSRRYFCYKCLIPMPLLIDRLPKVHLPVNVHIIRHPKEKDGKSTGVQCAILASDNVKIFIYPNFPDYRNQKAVLIFPDVGARTLDEIFSSSSHQRTSESTSSETDHLQKRISEADCFVFIDCTWFQVGGMRRHPHFHGIQSVAISGKRTRYWRPQHNQPDGNLATVEAVYHFCVEYDSWIRRSDESINYDGRYDDLLYFFEYFRRKVDENEQQRRMSGRLITGPFRRLCTKADGSIYAHKPSIFPSRPAQSILDGSKLPSMPVFTDDLIHHLEQLSLVRFSDEDAVNHLRIAVRYAQHLMQVDTEGVEPMYSVLEDQSLRLRPDQSSPEDTVDRKVLLNNAVKTLEGMYFVAPIGNVPLEEREDKIGHREIKKLRNA